jgi:hypothetical protein
VEGGDLALNKRDLLLSDIKKLEMAVNVGWNEFVQNNKPTSKGHFGGRSYRKILRNKVS